MRFWWLKSTRISTEVLAWLDLELNHGNFTCPTYERA